jgi:hypothetical protein
MAEAAVSLLAAEAGGASPYPAGPLGGAAPRRAPRRSAAEEAAAKRARTKLIVAMGFCFAFMIAEVIGG